MCMCASVCCCSVCVVCLCVVCYVHKYLVGQVFLVKFKFHATCILLAA